MKGNAEYSSIDAQTMKRVLDLHAEETISEEQVKRVLGPVQTMIDEGKFDAPRRVLRIVPFATAAAVLAVTAAVALTRNGLGGDIIIDLPETHLPLAGSVLPANVLAGRVTLDGEGVGGVVLTLAGSESPESIMATVSDDNGEFRFENIPDGAFRLTVLPPMGMAVDDAMDDDGWIIISGSAELVFGDGGSESFEGLDIRLRFAD